VNYLIILNIINTVVVAEGLEDVGDVDIALGPHFNEEKNRWWVHMVRWRRLHDLLVVQGTTKSTIERSLTNFEGRMPKVLKLRTNTKRKSIEPFISSEKNEK